MADRPTHLAKIICRNPPHLVFCDASRLGAGGIYQPLQVWPQPDMTLPLVAGHHHIITFVFLEPFSFYHSGKENCMADDASCLFELSDTSFLTRISVVYPDLPPLLELRS